MSALARFQQFGCRLAFAIRAPARAALTLTLTDLAASGYSRWRPVGVSGVTVGASNLDGRRCGTDLPWDSTLCWQLLGGEAPLFLAVALVGVVLGGLLVGIEPTGGDPDRLYRPLKSELAGPGGGAAALLERTIRARGSAGRGESGGRALSAQHCVLPDPRRRAGIPALDVDSLSGAGCHHVLSTRRSWDGLLGKRLAGVSFTLCGFQAIHASNEPFYTLMPYLPLALCLSERFMASGRIIWLALLAVCLGLQWTIGHFQIQSWTALLVVLTGVWRLTFDRRPWRRALWLFAGVAWGGAVAAIQLGLSWQLAGIVGQTRRTAGELLWYSFPPAHWFELALPRLIRELRLGPEDPYWHGEQSWGYEAAFYVGTIPLILAIIAVFSRPRSRATLPWKVLVPVSFAMATLPRWWPQGSLDLLALPGPGYFRVPARYTLLASLGLAVLAAQGFDLSLSKARFRTGLFAACVFGLGAAGAAGLWAMRPDVHLSGVVAGIPAGMLWAALAWGVSLSIVLLWRGRRLDCWVPLVVAAVELGILFYLGTTRWGRSIAIPGESPILSELARRAHGGLIGGEAENLPVRAGLGTGYPYLGFAPAQTNRLLVLLQQRLVKGEASGPPDGIAPAARRQLLRRLQVSHLVVSRDSWKGLGNEIDRRQDHVLDDVLYHATSEPATRSWSILELAAPFPNARVAPRRGEAPNRFALIDRLAVSDDLDLAWFLREDRIPERPDGRSARLQSWDGRVAVVEHDGPCDLVIARSFDPGWLARNNDGAEQPALPVDGGFLAVRLGGTGVDHVALRYQPPRLLLWATVSVLATLVAIVCVTAGLVWPLRSRSSRVGSNAATG